MNSQQSTVSEAVASIRSKVSDTPEIGIILGTGLGEFVENVEVHNRIAYSDIPFFPISTVESHSGHLLFGTLAGKSVIAMQGRLHLYEGYSAQEVTFPVRVMAQLGIKILLISNAAGGLDPAFKAGELMLLTDHINFQGSNPLTGPNVESWGPRFPDMSSPYDAPIAALAEVFAENHGIKLHKGVYVAVVGPNLETRAEYRFLRMIGGDAVGMSTVPEVLVARHMGIRVAAISVITDECDPETLKPVSIEDVLAAAGTATPALARILSGIIDDI